MGGEKNPYALFLEILTHIVIIEMSLEVLKKMIERSQIQFPVPISQLPLLDFLD